jgi:hypothetical protein
MASPSNNNNSNDHLVTHSVYTPGGNAARNGIRKIVPIGNN